MATAPTPEGSSVVLLLFTLFGPKQPPRWASCCSPDSRLDSVQAAPLPSTDPGTLGRQDDGYRAAKPTPDSLALLREQLLALLQGARFWDKSCDWMQVHLGSDCNHMQYLLALVVLE